MVGEACLPSNAYYPRTPDYTLYSGVHVCWSEHSDSSFVYGFMSLDYGKGTMTATTYMFCLRPLFVPSVSIFFFFFTFSVSALTHCSRDTRKRVLGKHFRPRSDAAERGV